MEYKGKVIYQPSGRAKEYAEWACNFYVGCSNNCSYCYLKKGIGKAVLGGDKPVLKKGLDENTAMEIFDKEFYKNLDSIKEHGLFLSFTTDPMLPETEQLTWYAIDRCVRNGVHVHILTKRTDWVEGFLHMLNMNSDNMEDKELKSYCHFGFSITGNPELELSASDEFDRIANLLILKELGFKTWVSFEPLIHFDKAKKLIPIIAKHCYEIKIGLLSGGDFKKKDVVEFAEWLKTISVPIVLKQSIKKYL